MNIKIASFFACILLAVSSFSQAALTILLEEVGNDVRATVSGSINSLAGATLSQTGASAASYNGLRAGSSGSPFFTQFMGTTDGGTDLYNNYTVSISPDPMTFGNGTAASTTFQFASSGSVSTDFILRHATPGNLWINQNYVLGTAITGTITWSNKTLSSLGVATGTYVWSWSGDTATLNVVPEPSALSLLAAGLGGLAILRRRRG